MVCIKSMRFILAILAVFALSLLSGCDTTPSKPEEPETAEITEEATQETTAPTEIDLDAPLIMTPSPYILDTRPVPDSAKREFSKVKTAMENKNWAQALGMLKLMVETYPQLSGPFVNLGIAYQQMGNVEEAEKALKNAIAINANNLDAYTQLGVLYREQGRFEEAEETYLRALKIWPYHLESNRNIGVLYDLYMGRLEEALRYYRVSQKIAGGEDRQLKGWIIDLERRMAGK